MVEEIKREKVQVNRCYPLEMVNFFSVKRKHKRTSVLVPLFVSSFCAGLEGNCGCKNMEIIKRSEKLARVHQKKRQNMRRQNNNSTESLELPANLK